MSGRVIMILKITQDEMRKIAVRLLKPLSEPILEIGCSSGNFLELLMKERDFSRTKYAGVDINKKAIEKAREKFPDITFKCIDISNYKKVLSKIHKIVSFQTFEHIGTKDSDEDRQIIKSLSSGTIFVFSVPNSPYLDEHKRWFELDGWIERYSPYLEFTYSLTIQNPKKENKRSFLFRGIRK